VDAAANGALIETDAGKPRLAEAAADLGVESPRALRNRLIGIILMVPLGVDGDPGVWADTEVLDDRVLAEALDVHPNAAGAAADSDAVDVEVGQQGLVGVVPGDDARELDVAQVDGRNPGLVTDQ